MFKIKPTLEEEVETIDKIEANHQKCKDQETTQRKIPIILEFLQVWSIPFRTLQKKLSDKLLSDPHLWIQSSIISSTISNYFHCWGVVEIIFLVLETPWWWDTSLLKQQHLISKKDWVGNTTIRMAVYSQDIRGQIFWMLSPSAPEWWTSLHQ